MTRATTKPQLVLGTAGHIDHGKSTLVQALTGTDPDRLKEEKRRGITIELGFAKLTLPDGRTMGVVDVPGHERFVRQMIAGATGIDVALLCIAADDGIMPQTIEHLHVLELLGVRTVVTALTKADAVDGEWLAFMRDEVAARLAAIPYAQAPIVAVSAKEKTGLDELLDAVGAAASKTQPAHERAGGAARLPVDRSFTIKGAGTVVTGTLWSGTVAPDDELEILPAGVRVRVRGVQEHNVPVQTAYAGNRTAVNLANVGTDDVRPGMLLATPGAFASTDRFDTWFTYLGSQAGAAPLTTGSVVRVAHGTAEVPGRVLFMDGCEELAPGESSFAQIRLGEPLPVAPRDRFVVRTFSPVEVVGGGCVLLAHPRRRTTLTDSQRTLLEALRQGSSNDALAAAVQQQTLLFSVADVARVCELDEPACQNFVREMAKKGALAVVADQKGTPFYARPSALRSLSAALENALLAFHAAKPEKTGVGKTELKRLLGKRLSDQAFDALVAHLQSQDKALVEGGMVSHPRAGAGAKRREEETAGTLEAALQQAGLTPPTITALAQQWNVPVQLAHKALGLLDRKGAAARVGDYYFSTAALQSAEQTIRDTLTKTGSATAAQLKDALGVSRKHAIPLLEHFDAKGLTCRQGEVRILSK